MRLDRWPTGQAPGNTHHGNQFQGRFHLRLFLRGSSRVWRVPGQGGLLSKWNRRPSKNGTGLSSPLAAHQHWHMDASGRERHYRWKMRGVWHGATPKRDHGDPQSFRLRNEGQWKLVRAEGLEPSRALRPNGFSCPLQLSPPLLFCQGLGSGLSLHHSRILRRFSGAARLVSTPSRSGWGRAWLGIAILQGSPTLSSSASPVSQASTQVCLKSVASADSATPAR